MTTLKLQITKEHISQLLREADEAGDLDMAAICTRALAGDAAALWVACETIHEAQAQAEL